MIPKYIRDINSLSTTLNYKVTCDAVLFYVFDDKCNEPDEILIRSYQMMLCLHSNRLVGCITTMTSRTCRKYWDTNFYSIRPWWACTL